MDQKPIMRRPRVSDYHRPSERNIGLELEGNSRSRKTFSKSHTTLISPMTINLEQNIPHISISLSSEPVSPSTSLSKAAIIEETFKISQINQEFQSKFKEIALLQEKILGEEVVSNNLRKQMGDLSMKLL